MRFYMFVYLKKIAKNEYVGPTNGVNGRSCVELRSKQTIESHSQTMPLAAVRTTT